MAIFDPQFDSGDVPDFPNTGKPVPPPDAAPVTEDAWEKLPLGSWTVPGKSTFEFPVEEISEDGGNRLVFRARPYRRGVKIDSTGGKEKTWVLECLFSNEANAFDERVDINTPLYPDVMNAIVASFDVQETGDLVIPTKGKKRCKAHAYKTQEKTDERVAARVTFTFVEDNEDSVDAASFTSPTMRGSGGFTAQTAQFDSKQIGIWNGSIAQLLEIVNEFNGILNLPKSLLDDVRSNANAIIRTVQDLLTTFSDEGEEALLMFTDPSSARLARRLNRLMDALSGAIYETGSATQPKTGSVAYAIDYSIFDIAALVKQDGQKLIELNQYRIEDLLHIEAGTEVLIFA